MSNTLVFAVPGSLSVIDEVHTNGLGLYSHETLEQIQARHPGAVVMDASEHFEATRKMMQTAPKRITRAKWIEMLEVLPPQRWSRREGSESFELCEHTWGDITGCFVRDGEKYYSFQGIAGTSHEDKIAKVRA